jgi:hypothetical protein
MTSRKCLLFTPRYRTRAETIPVVPRGVGIPAAQGIIVFLPFFYTWLFAGSGGGERDPSYNIKMILFIIQSDMIWLCSGPL